MVIISNYTFSENAKGEKFISLVVTGSMELIQSQTTGKFYATVRKAYIPCTFDELTAKELVGTKMSGTISKIPCEPYTYIAKNGEEVQVEYTYEYSKEVVDVAEFVMS